LIATSETPNSAPAADQEPPGAKKTDGAAQQMADVDRRGDHRAALLEQKGEIRGHRRSKREDQSKDHDKAVGLDAV
jgi:hypothetical protein